MGVKHSKKLQKQRETVEIVLSEQVKHSFVKLDA